MPKWTKEQEEAIVKSGSNIIVSAGAGSGKTAVLSERVINKIQNGIHVNELLILTFTRAAADEMKDRIRKKIGKIPEFKDELTLLSSAYITTFDSFALSVVKKYHYLLNISSNVVITDESIVKLEQKKILDNIFEELYKEKNENFINLIKKYCVKNDKSLKTNILSLCNKISDYIDRDEFIDNIINNFYEESNVNNLLTKYKEFINDKKKEIMLELDNMNTYFDYDYCMELQNSCLGLLNADIDELHLYESVKLPSAPRGSEEEAKAAKANLKKLLDDLKSYGDYGTLEDIKNDILSTKETVFTILDIVKKYLSEVEQYKQDNNIYTFSDISRLSIKILKESESIRNELRDSFKEIMIDEYQDTNDVQDIFISMIANDNVYMVGDIKQSIYRFRGSNPNIFKEKYSNYSNNIGGYKIDLIKNFRSRFEVLDNINKVFDLIMDSSLGSAEYKETHEMVYGNTAYDTEKMNDFDYDFEVLEYMNNKKETSFDNSEVEIFAIAKDIKNKIKNKIKVFDKETSKLREATYNDFVIILDRSRYFDTYKKIFEYLDIPLTILKDGKLNASTDIYLIKNIVDLIIHINENKFNEEFKYDFTSIGRSFLYEYTDEYIFDTINNKSYKDTTLYKDFSSIKNINIKTSSELFNDILDITDFYNKLYKIGDYENTNVRIETISKLSSSLSTLGLSITDFRDYLNDIIETKQEIKYTTFSGNSDSVKILTIHKSKGLEYPVCYFADLDHEFNTSELKDKFICDKNYGLIVPSNMEEVTSSVVKELYKKDFIKEEISEKIRLFYVALTRAREKMIIVLPEKETKKLEKNDNGVIEEIRRIKFMKLSDFMYGVKDYLDKYFKSIDTTKLGLTKDYQYSKSINIKENNTIKDDINVEEINIQNDIIEEKQFSKESNKVSTKEEIKMMNYGTKIHEYLELIDYKNPNLSLIEDNFIKDKIEKFLNNSLLENIKDSNIYHEYEFFYEKDNTNYHGIIDLMLEYDSHIDIIDFKLKNVVDENYKNQLNGYKNYIESITNKKVNTYLYSILNEDIKEI